MVLVICKAALLPSWDFSVLNIVANYLLFSRKLPLPTSCTSTSFCAVVLLFNFDIQYLYSNSWKPKPSLLGMHKQKDMEMNKYSFRFSHFSPLTPAVSRKLATGKCNN